MKTVVFPMIFPNINWKDLQSYFSANRETSPTRIIDQLGYDLADPFSFVPVMQQYMPVSVAKRHLSFTILTTATPKTVKDLSKCFPDLVVTPIHDHESGLELVLITGTLNVWEEAIKQNHPIFQEVSKLFETTCYKRWRQKYVN